MKFIDIHKKLSTYNQKEYLETLLDTVAISSLNNTQKIRAAHDMIMALGGYDKLFQIIDKPEDVIKNYKRAITNRLQFLL